MKEILEIINPLRKLEVEDFWKISRAIVQEKTGGYLQPSTAQLSLFQTFYNIQKRYESLTSQELRKEMFVCEVEEPEPELFPHERAFNKANKEYTEAQSKVWFDGFEKTKRSYVFRNKDAIVSFPYQGYEIWLGRMEDNQPVFHSSPIKTVFDLIIEIDRYNRTAQEPIQINFTENFVKQLIQ